MPKKKKIRVCYLDHDFKDWELIDKKTKKKISNVIFADIMLRAVKRWKNAKHTSGTEFREDLDLEWKKKK